MNKITKFFHELRNPHCIHCITTERELNTCKTCDVLADENGRLIRDNEFLRGLLLEDKAKPATVIESVKGLKPIQPSTAFIPTAVRRQMLETESRHTAALIKEAPLPDKFKPVMTAKDIEKELEGIDSELSNVRETK